MTMTKSLRHPKDLIASFSSVGISKPKSPEDEHAAVVVVSSACEAAEMVAAEYEVEDGPCSVEDTLALEVGRSAQEYLDECFHTTEISVLNRDKFEAVPEFAKSDFAVLGHLGKGSFSGVFEVVHKADSSPSSSRDAPEDALAAAAKKSAPLAGRGRGQRRASLSSSVASATRAGPSRQGKRALALKCLRPQIRFNAASFTIGAEDLVHETAILASLDHPHVIKLHGRASGRLEDAFVLNDGYFILLDRLDATLGDRIRSWKKDAGKERRPRGPTTDQLKAAHDTADALAYLHSRGIAFRDLKPQNVGFDAAGTLKLFDFGFAAGLPDDDPSSQFHNRCGTPRYMAPEVGLGHGYGLAADVYSLGMLLWEICALVKPFSHITDPDEFDRRVFAKGERPSIDRRWPAAVSGLMRGCWSAHPERRPTMAWVRSKLRAAVAAAAAAEAAAEGGRSPAGRVIGRRPGWARRRTVKVC